MPTPESISTPRPCPACESSAPAERRALKESMFGLGESFDYLTCADCGTVYIAEIPTDLGDYYSSKYYSFDLDPEITMGKPGARHLVRLLGRSVLVGSGGSARAFARVPIRQLRTLIALFSSIRTAGLPRGEQTRILDVGCGSGALIYALTLAGLEEVEGIDPFNESDRVLSTGARVLSRDLSEVEGEYDLVMLHHSFEHVPDPASTLAQARRVLAPNGSLLIRMPTVSSAAFERYGEDWVQLDPPRHLTVFSRAGMQRRAELSGYEVVSVTDDSSSFQFWGSEQVRAGVSLVDPTSHFVSPRRSAFDRAQLHAWDGEAAMLNFQEYGDQAAWVLRQR